jgi:hypothetical protein
MHLNCTHLVREGQKSLLPKSAVHEADMMLEAVRAAAPLFSALDADRTLRTLLSLFMPRTLRLERQAMKLQYNSGARLSVWRSDISWTPYLHLPPAATLPPLD